MRTLLPILLITLAVACRAKDSGTTSQTDTTAPSPGATPDSHAFTKYTNTTGGYQLEVPESWARTERGGNVSVINGFDGVSVTFAPASAPPTAASTRTKEARQIQSQGDAVTITGVAEVNLPGGRAVVIKYTSNSNLNPVTNKRSRLENEAYIFYTNGKEATLTLWAPAGAANVDQWKRMSNSFRWL